MKKIKQESDMCRGKFKNKKLAALGVLLLMGYQAFPQDGNAGLQTATSSVGSYFDTGCKLMYAVGAIMGLVGAIKVYAKMHGGDQHTHQHIAGWFGACIFLVVVATVIKSFFGV